MTTMTFKVFGRNTYDGTGSRHRMKYSFYESDVHDFNNGVKIDIECSDKTGTNDYVIVHVTCHDQAECFREIDGQLSDGIFENMRYGDVHVLMGDGWHEYFEYSDDRIGAKV